MSGSDRPIGEPPKLRDISEQLSVLAGHDVIAGAKSPPGERCDACQVWLDVSHLFVLLTQQLQEAQRVAASAHPARPRIIIPGDRL